LIGGDFRGAQVHRENEFVREGRYYRMQEDVEVAMNRKRLTVDVTIGRVQVGRESAIYKPHRYFALYEWREDVRLRAGRFLPNYGLNIAEHIVSTRSGLGFDQGREYDAIELSRITDTWNVFFTVAKGPTEVTEPARETAATAQIAYNFLDTNKLGANLWKGDSTSSAQTIAGLFGSLGFTERLHLMSEIDWRWLKSKPTDVNQTGFFTFNRISYEIERGVLALASGEFWQTNLGDNATAFDRYGMGLQLFPRPHFDIQLMWNKQRPRSSMRFEDYAWLMLHYYL
jgi:hypothetical protein